VSSIERSARYYGERLLTQQKLRAIPVIFKWIFMITLIMAITLAGSLLLGATVPVMSRWDLGGDELFIRLTALASPLHRLRRPTRT
jgi:hypothetical protein